MNNIGIETTQHVHINYEVAGIGDRIFAYFIDAILLFVYSLVVFTIWSNIFGETNGEEVLNNIWLLILLISIPSLLYRVTFEIVWNGYTIGKKLIGIRVVKTDGSRAGISSYLLRWLIGLFEIGVTSGSVALVTILINGKGQRLGDMAGGTCVIKERRNMKLDDTLFTETEEEYKPLMPSIYKLEDKDIEIIKEVLGAQYQYDDNTWFVMLQRTRKLIEQKLDTQKPDLNALDFLKLIVKDYNAYHGLQQ